MRRDPLLHLDDIQKAIARIKGYTAPMDYNAFVNDERTQDAVIRNLEVIGEAARALPAEIKAKTVSIEWPRIIALRNLLIHEYFGVSLRIIWDVVTTKLDTLDAACVTLRGENL